MDWIEFSEQSKKFLSRCDSNLFKRIKKKIDLLKENPVPSDAKFLGRNKEENVFRIRVGNFRIIYKIKKSKDKILISKIDKRDKVYD